MLAMIVPKRQNLSQAPLDARKDIRGRRIITNMALETWMEKITRQGKHAAYERPHT